MSYHIVHIDAPQCSISCVRGQLVCQDGEQRRSVPLEDVGAIVITSFSATIHSTLFLEAAQLGIGLVLCEAFKPVAILLPANRSTDTLLTRGHVRLGKAVIRRLWQKTIDAKTHNQARLARFFNANHPCLPLLEKNAEGKKEGKESACARLFWQIYGETLLGERSFIRGRQEGGLNVWLNYGYAVLLSIVLQKCFAMGIDPTFGIGHMTKERSTALAYDLMEPFRPCVDYRVRQWVKSHPDAVIGEVNKDFRAWITRFPTEKVAYGNLHLEIKGCIEEVVRSFRQAILEQSSMPYRPWIQKNLKWDG